MSDTFEPENYFDNKYPYSPSIWDKFVDKYFPPHKDSIFNKDNINSSNKNTKDYEYFKKLNEDIKNGNYVFKRLNELINPKLTKNYKEINPYIHQGSVEDCLLISFLNALQRVHKDKYLKLFGKCVLLWDIMNFIFMMKELQNLGKFL